MLEGIDKMDIDSDYKSPSDSESENKPENGPAAKESKRDELKKFNGFSAQEVVNMKVEYAVKLFGSRKYAGIMKLAVAQMQNEQQK